jgi:NAD/NADP transhydrogenase beta subunit
MSRLAGSLAGITLACIITWFVLQKHDFVSALIAVAVGSLIGQQLARKGG